MTSNVDVHIYLSVFIVNKHPILYVKILQLTITRIHLVTPVKHCNSQNTTFPFGCVLVDSGTENERCYCSLQLRVGNELYYGWLILPGVGDDMFSYELA